MDPRVYLVTCDYTFGCEYGIDVNVVGLFYTKEAAQKTADEIAKRYKDVIDEDEPEWFINIVEVNPNIIYDKGELVLGRYLE